HMLKAVPNTKIELLALVNTPLDISFQVTAPLADGQYQIKIQALDTSANIQTYLSPIFTVQADFDLKDLLCFPNPFNPHKESLKIEYQLTKEADVKICIYSISGERLWQKQIREGEPGSTPGYNAVEWNGINDYGETVANGPYIAYAIAKQGSETRFSKTKILVLK
ncbi:hypothetical protein ACFLZV_05495, partial [Candidatus Margulisiibacteriota bacterium]